PVSHGPRRLSPGDSREGFVRVYSIHRVTDASGCILCAKISRARRGYHHQARRRCSGPGFQDKDSSMTDVDDPAPRIQSVIQRRNLGDDVYKILWSRILSRDLHAGEKLSDLKLSAELGVSRTPVREALHRLLQDGVIEAQPNRGFFVTSFSARDIDEIFEIR